jgi:hypothetical protein
MFDGTKGMTTPAEIAASVARSGKLRAGETELASLKAKIVESRKQIAALASTRHDNITPDALLLAADARERELVEQLGPLRRKVVVMRQEHGALVRQAMQPAITAAAARGHDAMQALSVALGELRQINNELERNHGEPVYFPSPDLQMLVDRLSRLAGRAP